MTVRTVITTHETKAKTVTPFTKAVRFSSGRLRLLVSPIFRQ